MLNSLFIYLFIAVSLSFSLRIEPPPPRPRAPERLAGPTRTTLLSVRPA